MRGNPNKTPIPQLNMRVKTLYLLKTIFPIHQFKFFNKEFTGDEMGWAAIATKLMLYELFPAAQQN